MNRITMFGNPLDFLDWREGSGGTIEVFDIQVGSQRRCGIGRKMMEVLFRTVGKDKRVFAVTRADNEIAMHFYEACGFDVAGVLRRFYAADNGADAIMYVRSSGGPI